MIARGRNARRLGAVIAVLAGLSLGHPCTVSAQPVWDPAEIAHLAETSAQLAELLSQLVDLTNQMNDLSRGFGRLGTLGTAPLRLDVVEGLQGAGPDLGGLARALASENVRIGSLQDATALVSKLAAGGSGGATTTQAATVMRSLDNLHRHALEDGYALALRTREQVSTAPAKGDLLAGGAGNSRDLRNDVAADTAAGLAVVDQLIGMKAVLASILEIRASQQLKAKLRAMPADASGDGSASGR